MKCGRFIVVWFAPTSIKIIPNHVNLRRLCKFKYFKRQSHKMVKDIQTIRRQFAEELFECVWPFCDIGAEKFKYLKYSRY